MPLIVKSALHQRLALAAEAIEHARRLSEGGASPLYDTPLLALEAAAVEIERAYQLQRLAVKASASISSGVGKCESQESALAGQPQCIGSGAAGSSPAPTAPLADNDNYSEDTVGEAHCAHHYIRYGADEDGWVVKRCEKCGEFAP